MNSSAIANRAHLATSTIFLVPPRTDRVEEGRRLASAHVGRTDRDVDLALRGLHPDLVELRPPEGKERIGIGQVRDVARSAQFAPVHGVRKVCLIPDAERLTTEAANALLKTLEEPPREMAFLLLAGQTGDLLPTIVSRSRIVRLAPLDPTEAATSLIALGYPRPDAEWLVRVADRRGELEPFRKGVIDLASLRQSITERVTGLKPAELIAACIEAESLLRRAAHLEALRRASARDPAFLTEGVRVLASQERVAVVEFLGDLLCAAFDALRDSILNEGKSPSVARPGTPSQLRRACRAIDDAHRVLDAYAPPDAVLLTLFLAMGGDRHAP